ncbi:hypothetical protein [Polynucleobacter sp. Adler-ghost]|uniref:hypothetical protein n=1 Tax=Polynucleobacter sp. Adler-ghost TaxID=2770234 RepID=UPI00203F56DA|nr:hypothetical protein [Polynucleobacter sp. Adler-ghost]
MTAYIFGRHLMELAFALLVGSILMGCSLYPDINTDPAKNNKVTFRQDALDCAQSYPDSGSGVHVKQRIACMNLKGWH